MVELKSSFDKKHILWFILLATLEKNVWKEQSIRSFMRNFYPKQFFHSNMNFSENAHASVRSSVLTRDTNFTLTIKQAESIKILTKI